MSYMITKDIALQVSDLESLIDFFRNILRQEVTKQKQDTYKVKTKGYNLYLTSGSEFSIIMEVLVDDIEKTKEECLDSGCKVVRWGDGDYWLKHPLGFTFNLDIKRD
ncbi:MAG: VOC family protein [Candidatus Thorarchaeota archaeon]